MQLCRLCNPKLESPRFICYLMLLVVFIVTAYWIWIRVSLLQMLLNYSPCSHEYIHPQAMSVGWIVQLLVFIFGGNFMFIGILYLSSVNDSNLLQPLVLESWSYRVDPDDHSQWDKVLKVLTSFSVLIAFVYTGVSVCCVAYLECKFWQAETSDIFTFCLFILQCCQLLYPLCWFTLLLRISPITSAMYCYISTFLPCFILICMLYACCIFYF